jgi:hypothetical protein
MKALILFFAVSTLTIGCSTQYRTSDPQVSTEQLQQWLTDAANTSASAVGGTGTDVTTLAADPNTTIYFADTGGTMGPIATVLAFDNIDFWDPGTYVGSATSARVFFLDNPSGGTGSHQDALVLGIGTAANGGVLQYKTFTGTGSVDSGEFDFTFQGADGHTYTARSFDLDGDNLAANIQLKIFTTDTDGSEIYIGKFSILAGFQ